MRNVWCNILLEVLGQFGANLLLAAEFSTFSDQQSLIEKRFGLRFVKSCEDNMIQFRINLGHFSEGFTNNLMQMVGQCSVIATVKDLPY